MKIGLIYAMTGEIESLLTKENAEPLQTVAGVSFYRIRPDVIACIGGVGKVNAAMAAQLLISLYKPDLVLNAGVAGCFENVPIGTLVLAEGFLQHDVDTSPLGDPVGLVSTVNRVIFPTSELEKARAAMELSGLPALADDSGSVVDALGGAPGVYSARYGGCNTDEERTGLLLKNMEKEEHRDAKFVSCIAVAFPNGDVLITRGECAGELTYEPRGENGFGYDPIFFMERFGKTLAEVSAEEKNSVSHRGRALRAMKERLADYFKENGTC